MSDNQFNAHIENMRHHYQHPNSRNRAVSGAQKMINGCGDLFGMNKQVSGLKEAVQKANYRHADKPNIKCSTCKFFNNQSGFCSAWKFTAKADYVCDTWAPK